MSTLGYTAPATSELPALIEIYGKLLRKLTAVLVHEEVHIPSEETLAQLWDEHIPNIMQVPSRENEPLCAKVEYAEQKIREENVKAKLRAILADKMFSHRGVLFP